MGTIKDAAGGTVSGADVLVTCGPVSRSATSAADGAFAVADLPEARCDLQVESQDFEPKRLLVDLVRENARLGVILDLRGLRTFVAVTASRSVEESAARIPAHTTVIGADDCRVRAHQILPQALAEEPGIVVQQTTTAQGAPIIRGLIGYQNVAMIDGIRLNTSAWRSGPVQYLAWYHASLVDRIEVMRGPGSVLYGSDALGGTVHLRGIQPSFSTDGLRVHGAADLAASSADSGGGASARVEVSGARAGLFAGGGYDHFNDVRPGRGIDSHAAVTRFLGLPSDVLGSNRMRNTGYDQRFGHFAGAVGLGSSTRFDGNYHYNEQTGVSRYDRMSGGDGLFRSEFGPQRLDIGQLKIERGRTAFLDGITASISINRQADVRLEQARPIASVDAQQNTTKSLGY